MVIKIKDPLPGELPFMRRRLHPAVLRFKKNKQASQPVKFFQQELVLYDHETTDHIYSLSDEEVIAKYLERQDFIRRVKNQVTANSVNGYVWKIAMVDLSYRWLDLSIFM